MVNPTLLILAAGKGTRYGGPKFGEPVGPSGETILEYSMYDARRAGFGRIVFVLRGELESAFKDTICARLAKHVRVECVFQELPKLPHGFRVPVGRTKPWGTTHAILMAEHTMREPFAVINVDDFYGADSYRVLSQHLQSGTTDYSMVGYTLRQTLSEFGTVPRAICQVDEHGYLKNIVEMKSIEREKRSIRNTDAEGQVVDLSGNEIVSMNMWGFTPEVFPQLREELKKFLEANEDDLKAECLIPTTINRLITDGQAKVKVLHGADAWFGVTYPEDHAHAVERVKHLIEGGYYPKRLWT